MWKHKHRYAPWPVDKQQVGVFDLQLFEILHLLFQRLLLALHAAALDGGRGGGPAHK